jgi:hypothetical protein
MSRAQQSRWVAEVHKAMRTAIGAALKQQLEAPQELPTEIALLLAQIGKTASDNDSFARVSRRDLYVPI